MRGPHLSATLIFLGVLISGTLSPVRGQQTPPPADPVDVESLDAIMAAVYDAISGPAGEARDWDRFRSLFIPGARLIPIGRPQGGVSRAIVLTPDEYVERFGGALPDMGFFETEIGRTTEAYGPLVHLFSTYESRRSLDDPEPFARGINSFQLLNDGSRWWVVTIYWQSERPDLPIPEKYVGS